MNEKIEPSNFSYLDYLSKLDVSENEINAFRDSIPERMKEIFDNLRQEDRVKLIAMNNLSDEEFEKLKKYCHSEKFSPIIHDFKTNMLALSNYTDNPRYS